MIPALCCRLNTAEMVARTGARVTGGLVLGIDRDPAAKVTQVLFDSTGAPRVVTKVARQRAGEHALRIEHRVLTQLHSRPLPGLERTVPRPVLLERIAGRLVLAATAVPGGPLTLRYYRPGHVSDPAAVEHDFALAGGWLARFQRTTWQGQHVLGPGSYDEWVRPVLERYRQVVGWGPGEDELAARLAGVCAHLAGVSVPLVAVHGDYAIGNLLVDETAAQIAGVVDWELGQPCGLPFTDVLKFAASYGSFLDRAVPPRRGEVRGHPGWAEASRRWGGPGTWPNRVGLLYAFTGTGWFPRLVRQFLREHLTRLGAPPEITGVVLPLFVAHQATVLDNPAYRAGYRSVLAAVAGDLPATLARNLAGAR
jgi:Phosphotransferase enzyme family